MNQEEIKRKAAEALSKLPSNISFIIQHMPLPACWALAQAIDEIISGRNADRYNQGIAIGFILASLLRDEITEKQHNELALYVGNLI
ncbi:hypothetical protein [Enterobacter sp. R4-368]|uniref:hypothetical protein n=1 Tax=Enterobacter sp. R4-368 TaxID=1166130 RepID=UPI00034ED472|nr:hypothetical protein [Enterobacter sp. R4-368]AGN88254.1 hypothetical protein H650_00095 [Enterobacter sp. R4-368]